MFQGEYQLEWYVVYFTIHSLVHLMSANSLDLPPRSYDNSEVSLGPGKLSPGFYSLSLLNYRLFTASLYHGSQHYWCWLKSWDVFLCILMRILMLSMQCQETSFKMVNFSVSTCALYQDPRLLSVYLLYACVYMLFIWVVLSAYSNSLQGQREFRW